MLGFETASLAGVPSECGEHVRLSVEHSHGIVAHGVAFHRRSQSYSIAPLAAVVAAHVERTAYHARFLGVGIVGSYELAALPCHNSLAAVVDSRARHVVGRLCAGQHHRCCPACAVVQRSLYAHVFRSLGLVGHLVRIGCRHLVGYDALAVGATHVSCDDRFAVTAVEAVAVSEHDVSVAHILGVYLIVSQVLAAEEVARFGVSVDVAQNDAGVLWRCRQAERAVNRTAQHALRLLLVMVGYPERVVRVVGVVPFLVERGKCGFLSHLPPQELGFGKSLHLARYLHAAAGVGV